MSVCDDISVRRGDNAAAPGVIVLTLAVVIDLDADNGGAALFIDRAEIERSALAAVFDRKTAAVIGQGDAHIRRCRRSIGAVELVEINVPVRGLTVGVIVYYVRAEAACYEGYAGDEHTQTYYQRDNARFPVSVGQICRRLPSLRARL